MSQAAEQALDPVASHTCTAGRKATRQWAKRFCLQNIVPNLEVSDTSGDEQRYAAGQQKS